MSPQPLASSAKPAEDTAAGVQSHPVDEAMSVWLQMAHSCAAAAECSAQAMACARSGDYTAAVRLWHRSSSTGFGSDKSLYNLAICYENGLGVHRDINKVSFILRLLFSIKLTPLIVIISN